MPAKIKQQKKLVRLISALSDMQESVHAADLLLAGVPEEFYLHLFASMVVAYGRPFTENYGVGCIACDYPTYPNFGDVDMPDRHARLLDLRNKFCAHSSAEGTRVLIVPPNVPNPIRGAIRSEFDFAIGKRTFAKSEYVQWLREAPFGFHNQLHADIVRLLVTVYGRDANLNAPFELPTGHESFNWTQ